MMFLLDSYNSGRHFSIIFFILFYFIIFKYLFLIPELSVLFHYIKFTMYVGSLLCVTTFASKWYITHLLKYVFTEYTYKYEYTNRNKSVEIVLEGRYVIDMMEAGHSMLKHFF